MNAGSNVELLEFKSPIIKLGQVIFSADTVTTSPSSKIYADRLLVLNVIVFIVCYLKIKEVGEIALPIFIAGEAVAVDTVPSV